MKALPQLREAGWLYAEGSDIPSADVRLWQDMAEPWGWEVHLSDPAREPMQRARYADEAEARAELVRIYAEGASRGVWRVTRPEPLFPAEDSRPS